MTGLIYDIALSENNNQVLKTLRQQAKETVIAQGFPTPKSEDWKYTKIRELETEYFVFSPYENHDCSCKNKNLDFDAYEINFCNGKLCQKQFNLPAEVKVMSLLDAVKNEETTTYLNQTFDMKKFPFAALNTMYLEQGIFIKVSKDYHLNNPIALIYHVNDSEKYFCNIHNIIVAQSGSSLNLVEYFFHTGKVKTMYFNNIVNEIFAEKNSTVNHYKIQNDAFKAYHIALNCVNVKSDGTYNIYCLHKGENLSRNETLVRLQENNANTCVNAVYNMDGWATIDTTTNIEHLHPNTTSGQLVKGVVNKYAKGVFRGKIHIAPNAINTKGNQLHKALILSDDAEIDVKPELEIFADDVKCSHGATCGELDKEQMFYLRSRGISEENAKQILIKAFVDEPFSTIDNQNIKDWMQNF